MFFFGEPCTTIQLRGTSQKLIFANDFFDSKTLDFFFFNPDSAQGMNISDKLKSPFEILVSITFNKANLREVNIWTFHSCQRCANKPVNVSGDVE